MKYASKILPRSSGIDFPQYKCTVQKTASPERYLQMKSFQPGELTVILPCLQQDLGNTLSGAPFVGRQIGKKGKDSGYLFTGPPASDSDCAHKRTKYHRGQSWDVAIVIRRNSVLLDPSPCESHPSLSLLWQAHHFTLLFTGFPDKPSPKRN